MSVFSVFLIALGVSADAFAVALTCGVRMRRLFLRNAVLVAAVFAVFQMVMPLLGWMLASNFKRILEPVDHWIAFVLLVGIGGKMVWDAVRDGGGTDGDRGGAAGLTSGPPQGDLRVRHRPGVRRLLVLGVATSIDAAAVGVTLAMLKVNIVQAVAKAVSGDKVLRGRLITQLLTQYASPLDRLKTSEDPL